MKLAIVSVFWAVLTSFPKHPVVTPVLPSHCALLVFLFPALLHNCVDFIWLVLSQTHAVMVEDGAAASVSEPITTVTGGNKPLHRFLKGQPKSIGVTLVMMGVCLFMFGIPVYIQPDPKEEMLSPFWLGILFFICGLLYILSERNPSKKIIMGSLAMSIISIIGVFCACVDIFKSYAINFRYWSLNEENRTETDKYYINQYYNSVESTQIVFFCHSLIGGILLITMTFFSRAALRSSNTQAIVVMRNLSSAE